MRRTNRGSRWAAFEAAGPRQAARSSSGGAPGVWDRLPLLGSLLADAGPAPRLLPVGCSPRTCLSPPGVPGSPGPGWDTLPTRQEQPSPARLHFPGSHPSSVCPGPLPAIVPIPTPTFHNPPSSPGRIAGESSPPIPFPSSPMGSDTFWRGGRKGRG